MNVNLIGTLIDDLVENATDGEFNSVDASNIVSIGETILSTKTNIEKFYNALSDRIGKVIVKSLEYVPNSRGVRVDALEFGVAIQKIRFEMGKFSDSSTFWDSTDTQFNPFTNTPNTSAYSKIFKKFSEYEYRDLVPDFQLKSAFVDMAHMGAFLSGLYVTRQNALKLALEQLDATAIAYAIAKTVVSATDAEDPMYSVNVLSIYNINNGLECTVGEDGEVAYPVGWVKVDDLETPKAKEFWRWFVRDLKERISHVKKYTTLFNPDGRETFSAEPVVEVIGKVASACKVFMESDVYHNDIVALPNYNEVDYWTSLGGGSLADATMIKISDTVDVDGEEVDKTYGLDGVVAHIRDNDSVMTMVKNFREKSLYNPAAEVTNTWDKATMGYMCDLSETSVVISVADPIVVTSGGTSEIDYQDVGQISIS